MLVPCPTSHRTVPGPALPINLVEQAQLPLPISAHLFQEALRSADNLDESDLWRWEGGPPYTIDPTNVSTGSDNYTDRLVEVIHGVRLREQHKEDEARCQRFLEGDRTVALLGLSVEVDGKLKEWETLTSFLHDYDASAREVTMAKVYLQWLARTIYHLYHLLFL
jgi:hypothetical protein